MSARAWGRLNGAKVLAGFALAIVVAPVVAIVRDVLHTNWPTGGQR